MGCLVGVGESVGDLQYVGCLVFGVCVDGWYDAE